MGKLLAPVFLVSPTLLGHIAIIGHESQQEALIPQEGEEEQDLEPTACEGDGTINHQICNERTEYWETESTVR